jgi:hypothetical protein
MMAIHASHTGPISAFSSAVESGSRQENATKQNVRRDRLDFDAIRAPAASGAASKKSGSVPDGA